MTLTFPCQRQVISWSQFDPKLSANNLTGCSHVVELHSKSLQASPSVHNIYYFNNQNWNCIYSAFEMLAMQLQYTRLKKLTQNKTYMKNQSEAASIYHSS